ncbi:RMD9 [Candida margitis]|uniref:RMD9 n=1 Tax=Candida margitis TaxID=1775924 RepID=UPI0022277393|nr:RMD9 [Candida margitis]KAI5968145.1 RMD9 [Candida margitis]
MFRLINTSQGLRPSLISKIKLAKNGSGVPTASSLTTTTTTPQPSAALDSKLFFRNNSTASASATISSSFQEKPISNDYKEKFAYYEHKHHQPNYAKRWTPRDSSTYQDIEEISNLIQDEKFRSQMSEKDLYRYTANLYSATITSRKTRLGNSRNRDKDQADAFKEDVVYQTAVLNLMELVAAGDFNNVLSSRILFKIFGTLLQFKLNTEIMSLWENGVSQSEKSSNGIGQLYLSHDVLSIVLQVAYETKRFNYEEIKSIYNMSVNENEPVHPFLSDRIGQVAINEGDHARGLDALEDLMALYEKNPQEKSILGGLAQLHLSFIGQCKDVVIAKRFFDRAVDNAESLPYVVVLKAPYMVSFLENCVNAGDSMEDVIQLWSRISNHYGETSAATSSSKSATINAGLFKLFFNKYPEPNEESIKLLKLIFTKAPKIDEVFLNTLISNMQWTEKSLAQDVIDAFDKFNVEKSIISHRVILKQAGQVDYSVPEILQLWNNLLAKLDAENYKYIANADWSALRAATAFAENYKSDERLGLYFSLVKAYKNYMQHNGACVNFIRSWIKDANVYKQVSRITTEEDPHFSNEVAIEVPHFQHLRENVNYRAASKKVTDANPRLLD